MANDHLKGSLSEDQIPFVLFLRSFNENLGGKFEGVEEELNKEWKCKLSDNNGNVFIWVGTHQMQKYISKGWKIIGGGNLEKFMHNEGIQEIAKMVAGNKESFDELQKLKEENARLLEQIKTKKGGKDEQKAQL